MEAKAGKGDFEASLVYIVGSGPTRATQGDHVVTAVGMEGRRQTGRRKEISAALSLGQRSFSVQWVAANAHTQNQSALRTREF